MLNYMHGLLLCRDAMVLHVVSRARQYSPSFFRSFSKTPCSDAKIWLRRHKKDEFWKLKQSNENDPNFNVGGSFVTRSSFKLAQIDKHFASVPRVGKILRRNSTVIDVGAAPGGWTQVARLENPTGTIVAIDLKPLSSKVMTMHPMVKFVKGDFTSPSVQKLVERHLALAKPGASPKADVVLSDCLHNLSGITEYDNQASYDIAMSVISFAQEHLIDRSTGRGILVVKVLQSPELQDMLDHCSVLFDYVTLYKPRASRQVSRETYLVCAGLKAREGDRQ